MIPFWLICYNNWFIAWIQKLARGRKGLTQLGKVHSPYLQSSPIDEIHLSAPLFKVRSKKPETTLIKLIGAMITGFTKGCNESMDCNWVCSCH